jgi:hypothetical protein
LFAPHPSPLGGICLPYEMARDVPACQQVTYFDLPNFAQVPVHRIGELDAKSIFDGVRDLGHVLQHGARASARYSSSTYPSEDSKLAASLPDCSTPPGPRSDDGSPLCDPARHFCQWGNGLSGPEDDIRLCAQRTDSAFDGLWTPDARTADTAEGERCVPSWLLLRLLP